MFSISILVFVVVAPLLVLYAMGFRYSVLKREASRVGMLIIESQPRSALVYIDDQLKDDKTPYKKSSLLPDDYRVRLEKEGFFPWRKTLAIESRKVNWASNVRLFYEMPQLDKLVAKNKFDDLKYSSKRKKIFLTSNDKNRKGIWEYDLDSNKTNRLFPAKEDLWKYENAEFDDLNISENGKNVLFSWRTASGIKNYVVVKPEKQINLNNHFGYQFNNIQWSKSDDSKLHWLYGNNLYNFDVNTEETPSVVSPNVYNYTTNPDYVFLDKFEDNKHVLKRTKENDWGNEEWLVEIPDNQAINTMKAGDNNKIAFSINDILYLVKRNEDGNYYSAQKIFEGTKDFKWSQAGDKLLYYNDSEIWFYELVSKESDLPIIHPEYEINNANLITRSSVNLDEALWHPDEEHVLYSTNGILNAIELDERSTKNGAIFNNIEAINFEVDENEEEVMFLNKNKVLFKARISEEEGLF